MYNGDTLIVENELGILFYYSGDRVKVQYQETSSIETGCSVGKECEIIDIQEKE